MSSTGGGVPHAPIQLPPVPSWWQKQLKSMETWGIAHWIFIAVFVAGVLVGHFL